MKPLVLRDVAEEVELHESTVSRVTTNKYMLTPRGLFELKYFFCVKMIFHTLLERSFGTHTVYKL